MLKQFKNLVLYDIPPNDDEFLANPVKNLKKVLFDKDQKGSRGLNGGSRIGSSSSSASSSVSLRSPGLRSNGSIGSGVIPSTVNVVADDGHVLGLGNPKILSSIFVHLSTPDLLQARLVNLRWNAVASSVLSSKSFHTKVPPSKLKRFLKLMRNNIVNPFSSYAIRVDNIFDKHLQQFFHLFALKIEHLRVRLNVKELANFSKIIQSMSNLKDLCIIIFDEFYDDVDQANFKLSSSHIHLPSIRGYHWNSLKVSDEHGAWEFGLYAFPSIRKLSFESFDDSYKVHPFYDQIVSNIITACSNLREVHFNKWNSPLGKIHTKLGITSPGILDNLSDPSLARGLLSAEDIINLFFHMNLRFHRIALEVTPEVTWELLQDVIHKSSETLEDLTVANENIFERFYLTTALRHLTKLKLNLWTGPVDFLYFSKQFPTLRQISLNLPNLYEIETDQVKPSFIDPCLSVRTLTLTRLDEGVDVDLLIKLSLIFPNVRELFIEVKSGAVLEKIYELYPDLVVLCVELNTNERVNAEEGTDHHTLSKITNESFTGIPETELKVGEVKECGCPDRIEFSEDVRNCWNISCLRYLRTLLIRVPASVDNIALLEGISRLDRLQNLVLLPLYYDVEQPTKWCLRAIADNFPRLKTLVTSTELEYDESELNYLHSKLPGLVHKKRQ